MMRASAFTKLPRLGRGAHPFSITMFVGGLLSAVAIIPAAPAGLRYTGRVLYRANQAPVVGVLVELVEAEDDGKPTDQVLGSARADAEGRFAVVPEKAPKERVTLVVSAVRESATSGGDRRSGGYNIKTHRTTLGYLPDPSAAKANTVLIERRRLGHGSDDSDDD